MRAKRIINLPGSGRLVSQRLAPRRLRTRRRVSTKRGTSRLLPRWGSRHWNAVPVGLAVGGDRELHEVRRARCWHSQIYPGLQLLLPGCATLEGVAGGVGSIGQRSIGVARKQALSGRDQPVIHRDARTLRRNARCSLRHGAATAGKHHRDGAQDRQLGPQPATWDSQVSRWHTYTLPTRTSAPVPTGRATAEPTGVDPLRFRPYRWSGVPAWLSFVDSQSRKCRAASLTTGRLCQGCWLRVPSVAEVVGVAEARVAGGADVGASSLRRRPAASNEEPAAPSGCNTGFRACKSMWQALATPADRLLRCIISISPATKSLLERRSTCCWPRYFHIVLPD